MKATVIGRIAMVALALAGASCSAAREGTGSSFLIIQNLVAASGAEPTEFSGTLFSDVFTVVDGNPTVFADMAQATFRLGLKDPGTPSSPLEPTPSQFITIERYRVRYVRADGRNTPGVDVPYPFDGGFTLTVSTGTITGAFEIVRHVAKAEAPLGALVNDFTVITTIAEITFYGRDQTGHEVQAVGRITVDFGNFGDPA